MNERSWRLAPGFVFKNLRLRLTVWYLAFFSLLFVVFGLFLYGVLGSALEKRLDETLLSQANTTASLFLDEIGEMKGDLPKAASEAVSEMRLRGSTVAVFDGSTMLAASAPVAQPEFAAVAARAAASTDPDLVLAMPHSGRHGARAAVHRVSPDRPYLTMAVEPLDSIAQSLQV
ncbi:MAG TPA: hypothetical protein VGH38_07220, partial [Bryobacteraceae bacterium]